MGKARGVCRLTRWRLRVPIKVKLALLAHGILRARLGGDDHAERQIEAAMAAVVLMRFEDWLAGGDPFVDDTSAVREVHLRIEHVDELLRSASNKACSYQLVDGRELFCVASTISDLSFVEKQGLRHVARTSRVAFGFRRAWQSTCQARPPTGFGLVCDLGCHASKGGGSVDCRAARASQLAKPLDVEVVVFVA
ncbi:MAG: hypothetical protein QOF59_1221 [Actinomycetota bacterium]|nr:hypothetical protein [Actinomycetota bacterium]